MHLLKRSLTRFARWLAPPRTIRAQFLRVCRQTITLTRTEGMASAAGFFRASWHLYRLTGSLIIEPPPPPAPYTYVAWQAAHDASPEELMHQRHIAENLATQPVFSIITPVFNPPAEVLQAAIESVQAQSYSRWALVLVNAAPENPEICDLLAQAAAHPAVTVITLAQNLGISANTNAGLDAARGDYILFLDHDDLLAPDALFAVAAAIAQAPETDIVYFDEDKLSADGAHRHAPWFKPDWSPHLMLSTNLLMHGVYRRTLVETVGRLDPAMDGAQDWDLALRCIEQTQAIVHVPQILYHWRQVPGSAASSATAKPWALAAQLQAVRQHVQRSRPTPVTVDFAEHGHVRVRFPAVTARVSIIIPTRDKVELVHACLDSLLKRTRYPDYEILLVDTGSVEPPTHAYYATLATETRVRLLHYTEPFNFSRVNNWAARSATGELLLFLNNDVEIIDANWLLDLAGWAQQPEIGAVGAQLILPNGQLQHAGVVMGLAGHAANPFEGMAPDSYTIFGSTMWYRDYQAVTGACLMVRRSIFEAVGGFDEYYRIGYSDLELGLRIHRRGLDVLYSPFARLVHHEGGTRGRALPAADVLRASCQLAEVALAGDPYFNRNLSYAERQPALARPDSPVPAELIIGVLQSYNLLPTIFAAHDLTRYLAVTPPLADWPPPARMHLAPDARRLLLLTHDLSLSGAPILMLDVARQLHAAGYSLRVLSPEDGPLRAAYAELGAEVIVYTDLLEHLNNALLIVQALVGCHGLLANTILSWRALHAASALGLPAAWWLHESHFGVEYTHANPGVAEAFAAAALVILPTHHSARLYAPFLHPERSGVIHYGLALDVAPEGVALPQHSDARARVCVVQIGSIEPRKGQDILLRAIDLLPDPAAAVVEFRLIGRVIDPAFARQVEQMAHARPNITFLGERTRRETLAMLADADILVLSSRDEVLPVTVLEAMALGKAVVAASVGGVPEAITDGVHGLLFPAEDAQALARQLTRLATDSALRQQLGQNAAARVAADFAAARNIPRLVAMVEQAFGWASDASQSG